MSIDFSLWWFSIGTFPILLMWVVDGNKDHQAVNASCMGHPNLEFRLWEDFWFDQYFRLAECLKFLIKLSVYT